MSMENLRRVIRRFWTASVARQLMLGIALVHAVLMTIFVFDLVDRQREFMVQQSAKDALGMAATLAANGTSWILANDLVGMEEVIRSQSRFPNLSYAMFMAPDGKVLAYTDRTQVGRYVDDAVSRRLLSADPSGHLLVDTQSQVDAAYPVQFDGRLIGWARIGLDRHGITDNLSLVTRNGLAYTGIAILVGLVFAWFMAKGLTIDIRHLVEVTNRIRLGERELDCRLQRSDELGELGDDLQRMLASLSASESALEQATEQLSRDEERLRFALEGADDGLWDWDLNTNEVYYSPRWKAMLGYADETFSGSYEAWESLLHPEDAQAARDAVQRYLAGSAQAFEIKYRLRHHDGHWVWILSRGKLLRNRDGKAQRFVGTHVDISPLKDLEQRLYRERERALITLQSIGDGVITTRADGRVDYLNPVAETLTGWPLAEARDRALEKIFRIFNEITGESIGNPVFRCMQEGHVVGLGNHTALVNRKGQRISIEDSAAPIRNADGEIIGAVLVFHDATEARRMRRQMEHQATHDALTDLWNRRAFEERLQDVVRDAKYSKAQHALLYLDLDQFKVVNDTVGHLAGDELLKQITLLLSEQVRESDMLARLGGDEFGLLMFGCDMEHARQMSDKLLKALGDFRFSWERRLFQVGASIGLVQVDAGAAMNNLLSLADLACYSAKEAGRNRVHQYHPDDEELSQRHGEMHWVSHIKEALDHDWLELYVQRIQPLTHDDPGGQFHEVLVRLRGRDGALIPPGMFIPAAERYGIMPAVDRRVVEMACAFLARAGNEHRITVNLSGGSLGDRDLLETLAAFVDQHPAAAPRLCIEITETAAVTNLKGALEFIAVLKKRGVLFALDDFGSGLSSFAYLKTLPVDFLKIDGSFVRDMLLDPVDAAMVEAIHGVSRTMAIRTIAEFVENAETVAMLRSIGVHYAQGFGIEKPKPLAELEAGDAEASAG